MKQVTGIVYTKDRVSDINMLVPAVFYGETEDGHEVTVCTIEQEKKLWWIETLITGYRYKYTIRITI